MSLPVTTTAQMPFTDNSVSSAKMGVPKTFVGRGTYEAWVPPVPWYSSLKMAKREKACVNLCRPELVS